MISRFVYRALYKNFHKQCAAAMQWPAGCQEGGCSQEGPCLSGHERDVGLEVTAVLLWDARFDAVSGQLGETRRQHCSDGMHVLMLRQATGKPGSIWYHVHGAVQQQCRHGMHVIPASFFSKGWRAASLVCKVRSGL